MEGVFFLGVDVGTGSVRAAVVDTSGVVKASAAHNIDIHQPRENFYEQSSENIWACCCTAVRDAVASSGVSPSQIRGIGFDATCSLVVLDERFQPVSVSPSLQTQWNVVMWMDHRAAEQASRITRGAHAVLGSVGGVMSPEMETPKLLWLKENMPETWKRARHFFDLPDFMTFRATGSLSRSLCSLVCKWTYVAGTEDRDGWDATYFQSIGLDDLVEDGFARIGTEVREPGAPVPSGLSAQAAAELGLLAGTPVATSMIDAHAGGVGMFGMAPPLEISSHLAIIAGSSSCHMAVSPTAVQVHGIWGPYFSAMIPKLWLLEGGESATGKLLDHVVQSHRAYRELEARASAAHASLYQTLNTLAAACAKERGLPSVELLSESVHVLPYFHGNRSPLADASLLGCISGLSLSSSPLEELCALYVATVQALALGTRHIVQELNHAGLKIQTILVCGGLSHNDLFLQAHADATGCMVHLSAESEAVLVGAAVLGAAASGLSGSLSESMASMSRPGRTVQPQASLLSFYDRKFKVFRSMHAHQLEYSKAMEVPRLESR